MIQRDQKTGQYVLAFTGALQIVLRAAHDDLAAVLQKMDQHFLQGQDTRLVVDQRQHDDAKGRLQLRVGVKLVQHHLGNRVALEVDNDAHAVAVGFVTQIGNAFDLLGPYHLGDALKELGFIQLIGNLADDDALALIAVRDFDVAPGAKLQETAAGVIGLQNALPPVDEPRGGEIRPGKTRHQLGQRAIRVFQDEHQRINDFRQVVRRDVRRHADGNAGRAVDQQVGNGRGQNGGFLPRLVIVGDVIDGVLVDVA